MLINLNISAPLHLNGELVATQIKRNALDQEFKNNFTVLNNALNYNSSVIGSGMQADNLGTAIINSRHLTKQTGSKDFYYYDPAQALSYNSAYYTKWYIVGLAGGSPVTFQNATQSFVSNSTPLSVVITNNNSTLELDVFFEAQDSSNYQGQFFQTIELSTSPTFATISATKDVVRWKATGQNILTLVDKVSFLNLTAGTYYIRPKIRYDAASYGNIMYCPRTKINYEVYNTQYL